MQREHSDEHPLDDLLPLQHAAFAHSTAAAAAAALPVGLAPLTLVEDSLACSADFLLLHAISKRVGSYASKATPPPQPPAAPAVGKAAKPAVLLCTFKHSAEHYTHIARKWGVPLPPLQAAGVLYLLDDLSAEPSAAMPPPSPLDAEAAAVDAVPSAVAADHESPLQHFVSSVLALRRRHSSLLLLVDDAQWLALHSRHGDMEVLDALMAISQQMASMHEEAATSASSSAGAATAVLPPSAAAPAAPPSALLVVSHGDVSLPPPLSLLRRQASTLLRLSSLHTGYSREISGVLSVQQQALDVGVWSGVQRFHYKLTDSGVKLNLPGHSSHTLQQ